MIERILRVIKLDKSVYAEVEFDQTATSQAAIVVAIVAVLSAIGGGLGTLLWSGGAGFIMAFLGAIFSSFVGWLVWSAVTYFVGTSFFHGEATLEEMLRVIGFAQVPLALGLFSFIPCLGWLLSLAGWLLSLYTGFQAMQEGLDLDAGKTNATAAIGWAVALFVNLFIRVMLGAGMVGIDALVNLLNG